MDTVRPVPSSTDRAARVALREPLTSDGFVDGAWWPHSRDLTVELPLLLAAPELGDRGITRLSFNLVEWDAAPRRLVVAGRRIRLGGFNTADAHTVRLADTWGRERIDLVLIAPDTETNVAHRIMELSVDNDEFRRPARILSEATES